MNGEKPAWCLERCGPSANESHAPPPPPEKDTEKGGHHVRNQQISPPEIPPKLTHTHSHTWPASHTHETKTAVALNVTFYLCTRSNFQPSNRRKPPSPGPSFSATICKKWAENRFYPLEMRFRFIFAPGDRTDSYFTQVMYTTVLYSTGWAIISCLIRKWSMVLGGALKGR